MMRAVMRKMVQRVPTPLFHRISFDLYYNIF